MVRNAKIFLGILTITLGLLAQGPVQPLNRPGQPGQPTQPPPTGTLIGTVVEKGSKVPLERVVVEIVGSTGTQQQTASNSDGKFSLPLPPGTYRLTYRRQGDSGNIGIPMVKVVSVPLGEAKVDMEIPPTGELSGRVLDSRGEPVPGARVTALLRTYEIWSTKALYQNTPMSAQANDQGEYRITDVPDGIAFYLYAEQVSPQGPEPVATAAADPALRRPINASSFYPSSIDPSGGQAVTLSEGERKENLNIRMVRSQSYCVEDTVMPGPAQPNMRYNIQVDVTTVGGGIFNDIGSYRQGRVILLSPEGKARVCGLWPGTYRFSVQPQNRGAGRGGDGPQAANATPPPIFFGSGEFTVIDKDLTKLTVKGSNMFDTQGEIVVDGPPPTPPLTSRVRVVMVALTPTANPTNTDSAIPGKFVLKNRNIDRYFLRIQGLPNGWYIKNVMYGNEDLNLRVNRFILDKPDVPLKVVLGQNGAKLRVKVTDDKGQPVMGKRVIVVRTGLNEPPKLVGQMLTSYSDEAGECSTWTLVIEPPRPVLAPGDYYVLATDMPYNQTADVMEQIHRALQASATKVTLQPGGSTEISIKPVVLR
jgi:hypothetical protein